MWGRHHSEALYPISLHTESMLSVTWAILTLSSIMTVKREHRDDLSLKPHLKYEDIFKTSLFLRVVDLENYKSPSHPHLATEVKSSL